jgi:very-short-patch-repair endonuclease
MDVHDHLMQLGGVARTGQLLAAGFTRTDINRLAKAGVRQPRRGIHLHPDARPEFVAALRHNAKVSCASAASHYGLWLRDPPLQHHLACDHGHGRGFIRHRTLRFEGHPVLPVAAVQDVVLHAMGCLPPPASTALAVSAMRVHKVPLELLQDQLRGSDRSGPALAALRLLDRRCESILEVDARHLFTEQGISFEQQVRLDGIGRVDFLVEGFLIVEVDGYEYHSDRQSMLNDKRRDNAATVRGFPRLRYMPEDIWFEPERVVAEIRAVLALRNRVQKAGR